jgi:excinuclease UvrABC nuclease subunit
MEKENLWKIKLPDNPGVYFFLGNRRQILYIGKATSLKNRVRSYFAGDIKEKRSELIEKMVKEQHSE